MTTIDQDVATLGALYEAHGARLRQLCERRLGNAADAEDAAHEALLKLWRALPGYDTSRPMWPWLAKIALNVCTDLQRRQATARTRWVPPTAADAPPPDEAVLDRERGSVVRDALGQLAPSAATALFLRDVEGWDYDRIGGHLERTPGAARVAVTRARHQLRTQVESLARERGQWPLAGVLSGLLVRARRGSARARAAVREAGARSTAWATPGVEAVAGSAGGVVVPTVVGALVVLGSMILPGSTSMPTVPGPSGEVAELVLDTGTPGSAVPGGDAVVPALAPLAPLEPPALVGPAPAAPALELAAPPDAPAVSVEVPATPELPEDTTVPAPPAVAEPSVRIAAPSTSALGAELPHVTNDDASSLTELGAVATTP